MFNKMFLRPGFGLAMCLLVVSLIQQVPEALGLTLSPSESWKNIYGVAWRDTPENALKYARQMGYDYIPAKAWPPTTYTTNPAYAGLKFYIVDPENMTGSYQDLPDLQILDNMPGGAGGGRILDTTIVYTAAQRQWYEKNMVWKSNVSWPANIATSIYPDPSKPYRFNVMWDYQQQAVIDAVVNKIIAMFHAYENLNMPFTLAGYGIDMPLFNMEFRHIDSMTGTQVRNTLSYWTGVDSGVPHAGITQNYSTYTEGMFAFHKQLARRMKQEFPGAKWFLDPYFLFSNTVSDEWINKIKDRADKVDLTPDLMFQEGATTAFVDDPLNFSSGVSMTKDRVGSSQRNVAAEVTNRLIAAKAGMNGAWYNWFGQWGAGGKVVSLTGTSMPNFQSITDVYPRLKLVRCVPNWDNLLQIPLTSRSWNLSTTDPVYNSYDAKGQQQSHIDKDVIYARHWKNGKLFAVFTTTNGVIHLKTGERVQSVYRVDGYFIESTDASADFVSLAGSDLRLKSTVVIPVDVANKNNQVMGNGYIFTVSSNAGCADQPVATACGSATLTGVASGVTSSTSCPAGCTGSLSAMCTNGTFGTISGSCVPGSCPAKPVATACGNATLASVANGTTSSVPCPTGCSGTLSAMCSNGIFGTTNGSCTPLGCTSKTVATTCGNATLAGVVSGVTSAVACPAGCSGTLSAVCTNGTFGTTSGSCTPNSCSSKTVATVCGNATLSSAANGATSSVACPAGCSGTLSAVCTNGTFGTTSGTCAPVSCTSKVIATVCGNATLSSAANGAVSSTACPAGCTGSLSATCMNGTFGTTSGSCIVSNDNLESRKNIYGIAWRDTPANTLKYARQMGYDYIPAKAWPPTSYTNNSAYAGLKFYVIDPQNMPGSYQDLPDLGVLENQSGGVGSGRLLDTSIKYSDAQRQWYEKNMVWKSNAPWPGNIATSVYPDPSKPYRFDVMWDYQQQAVIDALVNKIIAMFHAYENRNMPFTLAGYGIDVPLLNWEFRHLDSAGKVVRNMLSYWTGGDTGVPHAGITQNYATYTEGMFAFHKQLAKRMKQEFPDAKWFIDPYWIFSNTAVDEWVKQIKDRTDKNDLTPDMAFQEGGASTAFVDEPLNFSSGVNLTKDRVGNQQRNVAAEVTNRLIAAKAGINGAWYNWFGQWGIGGTIVSLTGTSMPNFQSITDVYPRLKLIRCVPNWDNLLKIPLTSRVWNQSTTDPVYDSYDSKGQPQSHVDKDVMYARHWKNGKLFAVFTTTNGVIHLKAGEKVKSVYRVDGYFIESTDASADFMSLTGSDLRLKSTVAIPVDNVNKNNEVMGTGYIITVSAN